MASFDERYPMPINVASLFSAAEVAEMRENFAKFDDNGDGSIDERELMNILGIAGADTNPEVIAVLLAEADTNGDGKISFEEYVNMMYKTKKVC
jgi:calmodulin